MNYSDKLKMIRPFVSFNFDLRRKLSPAEKSLITRYYNAVYGIDGIANKRGYDLKTYRPRNKQNLNAMKAAQGLDKGYAKFKAIPVMVVNKKKARVKVKKDQVFISESGVSRTIELYNMSAFIKNPEKEIKRVTKKYPKDTRFTVLAGNYEIVNVFRGHEGIKNEILRLREQYKTTYKKWMRGIAAYSFNDQKDIEEYRHELMENRKKVNRRKRRNGKKKNRRN